MLTRRDVKECDGVAAAGCDNLVALVWSARAAAVTVGKFGTLKRELSVNFISFAAGLLVLK